MAEPLRLFLAGPAGAGKTEVAEILEKQHRFRRIGLGDLCREECRQRGWPEDRAHLQAAGDLLRATDPARLAPLAWERVRGVRGPVVVEGVRLAAEATYLRARGMIGVAVDAPEGVRAARLIRRDGRLAPDHRTEREAAHVPVDLRLVNGRHDHAALARQVRIAVGRPVILQAEREGRVKDLGLRLGGIRAVRQVADDLDRIATGPVAAGRRDRGGLER